MAGQSTPSSKEASETHRFAPVPPGDRALAALLVLVAAFVLWAFWGLMPDFPRITRGTLYVFLLAGACLAGALAALRHTPHQAEVAVTRDGIYLRASGGAPIAAITLGWADIERITFRTMNNSRHVFLVFTCGPGSPRPGRELACMAAACRCRCPRSWRPSPQRPRPGAGTSSARGPVTSAVGSTA